MSLELFGHPFSSYTLEGADPALGRRDAVRISQGRRRRARERRRAQAELWPFGQVSAAGRRWRGRFPKRPASSNICRRIIRGPNVWIPDGELGRRVRFLDRFFDLHVQGNMQPSVNHALAARRHGRCYGAEQGREEPAHRLRLARGESAGRRLGGRRDVHAGRLRGGAGTLLRRLGRGDRRGDGPSSKPIAPGCSPIPRSRERSMKRGHIGPISRSARRTAIRRRPPTSSAADRLRSPRRAALVRSGRRHSCRDGSGGRGSNSAGGAAWRSASSPRPSTDKRSLLGLAEARRLGALADRAEAAGDRVERIGEVAPPRRRVGAVRGELAARPVPAGERRLRVGDLVRAHALEEIVLRIVLADMVEAQEAPVARARRNWPAGAAP